MTGVLGLGVPELVIVGGIILLLFGPSRLPGLGGALGRGIREFKDAFAGEPSARSSAPRRRPPKTD